jgi:AAA domain
VRLYQAGELLESHVITSLTNQTKHLILIGDHKQLRPKAEVYKLQVESGDGYCLNRSLLERLVTQQPPLPSVSLLVQHRMRPEICSLIREIYPGLQDHYTVHNRPGILGLKSDCPILFWDHKHCEDKCSCHYGDAHSGSSAQWGFGSKSCGSVDYASMADTSTKRELTASSGSSSAVKYSGMYSYNEQQYQQRRYYTQQQSASAAAAADIVIAQYSRSNSYEVDMCVATVKYLLQQSYTLSQLVVLTPYLGQLRALQRAFDHGKISVLISELDEAALVHVPADVDTGADDDASTSTNTKHTAAAKARAHAGSSGRATRRPQSALRLSTVDGFQGEVRGTISVSTPITLKFCSIAV